MQDIIWLVQHHADIVAQLLVGITGASILVHGSHVVVGMLAFFAKWTTTKADDEAIERVDALLTKAESGLAWLQAWIPTIGVNRAKATLVKQEHARMSAARRASRPPRNSVDTSAIDRLPKPPPLPSDVPTKPDHPKRRS